MATPHISLIFQLFVLLNPFASFPFLVSALERKMNVRRIAIKSLITAFILAIVITLFGSYLFDIFGISIESLRIAGGVVLLLLGVNMVIPKDEEKDIRKVNTMVTLIATPMLTGPATISFVMIKAYELGKAPILFDLCLAFFFVGVVFIVGSLLIKKINPTLIDIVSRIMGLFLSAVAIEMIVEGIKGAIRAAAII